MPRKRNNKKRSKKSIDLKFLPQLILLIALSLLLVGFLTLDSVLSAEVKSGFYNIKSAIGIKESPTLKGEPILVSDQLLKNKSTGNPPIRILIPGQKIDLKIVEAPVIDGYWETSDLYASHGEGSDDPGQNGNMVIFAHAREGLFYNLKNVKVNDQIYVFTNNKWYSYRISDITLVYPNQVKPILPTKTQELTLYTCTGFADEKRLIVLAKPL